MVREDQSNRITYYRVDKAKQSGATSPKPTCWCRDCGAISVSGRKWRLPNWLRSERRRRTKTRCGVPGCGLPQYRTPHGDVCDAGHGGAPGIPVGKG
jgi:hypothetical protein